MKQRLRQFVDSLSPLGRELLSLTCFFLCSYAVVEIAGSSPRARLGFYSISRGLFWGLTAALVSIALTLLLPALLGRNRFEPASAFRSRLSRLSRLEIAGIAISRAAGEEFFLRGVLFGLMVGTWDLPFGAALLVNLGASWLVARARTSAARALIEAGEGTIIAYALGDLRSITALFTARLVLELVSKLALRGELDWLRRRLAPQERRIRSRLSYVSERLSIFKRPRSRGRQAR